MGLWYIHTCCRRDSAGRRSLRRSRSYKVIYLGTSRTPICDLLLVNNINLHPISHLFQVIAEYLSNLHFRQEEVTFP